MASEITTETAEKKLPGQDNQQSEAAGQSIRGRFWIACALLIPANLISCVWAFSVNPDGPWFDECPLLANVVLILFALVGVNALFRRFRPRWVFSQTEMLLLYTVLAISTAMGGSCYTQGGMTIVITHPYYFGIPSEILPTPLYDGSTFIRFLPTWLVVTDQAALKGFWQGHANFLQPANVKAWAVPLLAWTGFIVVLFFATMCLNIMLRRHWMQNERLTFPIVLLPLEMTHPSARLFRRRLLWLGLVPSFAIQILNGLAYFYPTVPTIRTIPMTLPFPIPPWNAIDTLQIAIHPFMIGLGYLLPQDLLFSSWFFHLFWQMERVLFASWGFSPFQRSNLPDIQDQAFGGAVVLGLLALWGVRRHLKSAMLSLWRTTPSDAYFDNEALSLRGASIGLLVSTLVVLAFFVASGMSVITAALVLVFMYILLVAITRIRAESGGPLLDFYNLNAPMGLTSLAGNRAFTAQELTAMSLHQWYVSYGFDQPMPYGLEAMKMAQESRRSQRLFFKACLAAAVIGMLGTLFVEMILAYKYGEAARFLKANWPQTGTWSRLVGWLNDRTSPNPTSITAMLGGAGMTLFLAFMRTHFLGWPFHPVPFIVTASWGGYVGMFWFPFFIAWIIKSLILRYTGLPGFRAALPFFYGLIIGEMTGGMVWPIFGMLTGKLHFYSFFGA